MYVVEGGVVGIFDEEATPNCQPMEWSSILMQQTRTVTFNLYAYLLSMYTVAAGQDCSVVGRGGLNQDEPNMLLGHPTSRRRHLSLVSPRQETEGQVKLSLILPPDGLSRMGQFGHV